MKNNLNQQVHQLEQELDSIKQKIQLLKEQSEFKPNDWLYVEREDYEYIFRFKKYDGDDAIIGTEIYGINLKDESNVQIWNENRFLNNFKGQLIQLATTAQIKRILITIAKHKGFNVGTKFISAYSGNIDSICSNELIYCAKTKYNPDHLAVYRGNFIYYNGNWATISPKLFNTEVSVEELTAFKTVMNVIDRMKSTLVITKNSICNTSNSVIEYDQLNDMIDKYSKE